MTWTLKQVVTDENNATWTVGTDCGIVRAERAQDAPDQPVYAVVSIDINDGHKLGTHVLMQVVRWIRKNWCDIVTAEVPTTNTQVVRAYENAGFERVTEIDGTCVLYNRKTKAVA